MLQEWDLVVKADHPSELIKFRQAKMGKCIFSLLDYTNCKESGEKFLELLENPTFCIEELELRLERVEFMGKLSGETGGMLD